MHRVYIEGIVKSFGYETKTTGYRTVSLDVSRILNKLPDWTASERNENRMHIPVYGRQRVWSRI